MEMGIRPCGKGYSLFSFDCHKSFLNNKLVY
jgi:hypothetical protein